MDVFRIVSILNQNCWYLNLNVDEITFEYQENN